MYLHSKEKLPLLRWVLEMHQNVIMLKGSDQMVYCHDNPVNTCIIEPARSLVGLFGINGKEPM